MYCVRTWKHQFLATYKSCCKIFHNTAVELHAINVLVWVNFCFCFFDKMPIFSVRFLGEKQTQRRWITVQITSYRNHLHSPQLSTIGHWKCWIFVCTASISCLVSLHTPMSYGSSSQELETELHLSSSSSIFLFVSWPTLWTFFSMYLIVGFQVSKH